MPRKTITRKTTTKVHAPRRGHGARNARRRARYNPKASGPFKFINGHDPFKPFMFVRLHYTQTHTLTVGTSGVFGTEQIYRLNSLYDCDYSGTGHQPYGFDQLAALYRRVIVNAVKIEIIATDPSQDGLTLGAMIQPANGAIPLTGASVDYIKEMPMALTRAVNNTGSQKVRISQYVDLARLNGLSKTQWNSEMSTYGSTMVANPTATPYLRLSVADLRGGSTGTIVVRTSFVFYCKFYERIVLPQS